MLEEHGIAAECGIENADMQDPLDATSSSVIASTGVRQHQDDAGGVDAPR